MKKNTFGIHHITSIVGHPQENFDFYSKILGLRFIKKTVNFDDPETYHLYFGNESGKPGTVITFFPQPGAIPGVIGDGQVGVTSYAIPKGALEFWENRLKRLKIKFSKTKRFNEEFLEFNDSHGLKLEMVERIEGMNSDWEYNDITLDVAIKGFAGAVLYSSRPIETANVLVEILGLKKIGENEQYLRFESLKDIGNIIDLKKVSKGLGNTGIGVVHHIAWRTNNVNEQIEWKEHIESYGYRVTKVLDRNYFKSIYFREKGGILFEIATDGPGFLIDEKSESLGGKLMIPPQHEGLRELLEKKLIPIE